MGNDEFHERVMAAFFDQQIKIAMTYGFFDELSKIAARELTGKEKVLKGVDAVRPYAHRAVVGAIPGAVIGGALGHLRGVRRGAGVLPAVGAALGAGAGIADKALEDLSESSRRYGKLLSSYQEKEGAFSGDLRRTHVGGARPPTEDSKLLAEKSLTASQSVGKFNNKASKRSISASGPTVKDLVL